MKADGAERAEAVEAVEEISAPFGVGIDYAPIIRSALNNLEAVIGQYRAAGFGISARISNGRIYNVGAAVLRD